MEQAKLYDVCDVIAMCSRAREQEILANCKAPKTPDKIRCTDGSYRTPDEYEQWISNLKALAEIEPTDLSVVELKALLKEGLLF